MPTPVQSGNSTPTAKPANLPAQTSPTERNKPSNRETFESPQDRFTRNVMGRSIMTAGGLLSHIGKGIADWKNRSNPERELNK